MVPSDNLSIEFFLLRTPPAYTFGLPANVEIARNEIWPTPKLQENKVIVRSRINE